jgi:beta-mannosidase
MTRRPAFHSEYGAEGAANIENVANFIQEAELWPPDPGNDIWAHRGEWWINTKMIESLFGDLEMLPDFFRFSQFVQWDGLRCITEAGRTRKFACGGTIPWMLNEPWPNLICTNAVDWYTMPKMAYYSVAHTYAPTLVAARFEKLGWRPRETFRAGLYIVDSLRRQREASVEWMILDISGQSHRSGEFPADVPERTAVPVGTVEWPVPSDFEGLFPLKLTAKDATGGVIAENTYIFSAAEDPIFLPMRSLPETKLRILGSQSNQVGDESTLTVQVLNDGNAYAFFVRAVAQEGKRHVYFTQNYLMLAPQERGVFEIKLTRPVGNFTFAGWNTNEVSLP